MKIKTTYVPADGENKPFMLPGVYTLADIQKLGDDLVTAGVTQFDTMNISVNHDGWLTIAVEKTIDTTPPAEPAAQE